MVARKNYTVKEIARKLKVSTRTVQREIRRGHLKAQRAGRKYLVADAALEAYLNRETIDLSKKISKFCRNKREEMVVLLQKLISMPSEVSSPPNEEKIAYYLKEKLETLGIRSLICGKGKSITVRGTFGYADNGILLDCPLDTTPAGDVSKWSHPPFEGVIKRGRMYGRGTADAKAGIVAMIYAVLALREFVSEDKLRVELVFDGGEQDGSYLGMHQALEKGLPVQAGIIGYAGDWKELAIGCRGYHRFTFTTHGQSVHTGSRFKAGVNAISQMVKFISEMEKAKLPKPRSKYFYFGPRQTFAFIEGGRAINIVPDECQARLDVRTLPEQTKPQVDRFIRRVIRKVRRKDASFNIDYQYDVGLEGYVLDEKEGIIQALLLAITHTLHRRLPLVVHGPSHIGALLFQHHIPVVVWGPKGENVHSYDEYVEINSIPLTAEVYAKTVLNFFGIASIE